MALSDFLTSCGVAVFLSFFLLTFVIAASGKNKPTSRCPAPDGQMIFREPFSARAPTASLAVAFTGATVMLLGKVLGSPGRIGVASWFLFGLLVLVILAISSFLLHASGPSELHLDLEQRTYHRISGWPLFPKIVDGPWAHISGVYIRRVSGRSATSTFFIVGIAWRDGGGQTELARYDRKYRAEGFAERLQEALALPRTTSLSRGNPLDDALLGPPPSA